MNAQEWGGESIIHTFVRTSASAATNTTMTTEANTTEGKKNKETI